MSYMKVLKKSGVYLWIRNTEIRNCKKDLESKRKNKIYKKMKYKIQKLDCEKEQKEELLLYLQQLH